MPAQNSPSAHTGGIFITGTDTNIGKTFVSALLLRGSRGTYWKPIQSGIDDDSSFKTDRQWVQHHSQLSNDHFVDETYLLKLPAAPNLSARVEGIEINLDTIALPKVAYEPLIVEGAGGVMVPLNDRALIIDLIRKLRLPVVIVSSSKLGTINHTCLTVNALNQAGIPILGVVMNGPMHEENMQAIQQFARVPVLAALPFVEHVTPAVLDDLYNRHFRRPFWNRFFEQPALTGERA